MNIQQYTQQMFADVKKYVTQMVQNVQLNGTAAVPSGTIIHGMWAVAPDGYLLCDGAEYSVNDYYNLYNVLVDIDATTRATWGSADWTTTFNVPDLRGEFLRMAGTNVRTNQGSGASVGVHQNGTTILRQEQNNAGFNGPVTSVIQENADSLWGTQTQWGQAKFTSTWASSSYSKMTARPTNTSVNYAIRI